MGKIILNILRKTIEVFTKLKLIFRIDTKYFLLLLFFFSERGSMILKIYIKMKQQIIK